MKYTMTKDGCCKRNRSHAKAIPSESDDDDSFDRNYAFDADAFDEEKAYKAMAEFLCDAGLPPSTVKQGPFRSCMKYLNPSFNMNYDTIVRHCLEVEKANKMKMKNALKGFDGKCSLSMEIMRPDPFSGYNLDYNFANERIVYDYLCVKAHFIDEDWKLRSSTLGYFSVLDGTEQTMPEDVVMKLLSDWEIEDKVSTITSQTDSIDLNESVMVIKDKLQPKVSFHLDGRFFHVACCVDILRSIAVEAFSGIEDAINTIRAYSFWKRAPLYWDNTLGMLQEALELEAEGRYHEYDVPTPKEWEKCRGVCKLVQKVYDVAEVLFETNYANGGGYFHNLQELRANLIEEAKRSGEFTKKVAKRMLKKLDKYWGKDSLILLALVTTLDPRYKMKYFEFCSLKYGAASVMFDIQTISDSIHKLYDDYASCVTKKEYPIMSESDSESEEELPLEVKERRSHPAFGFNCLEEYQQFIQSDNQSQPSKSELDSYLEDEPIVAWSNNFDVISWWKDASPKYPTLSKMARDLLPARFSLVTGSEAYHTMVREPDQNLDFLDMVMTANKV